MRLLERLGRRRDGHAHVRRKRQERGAIGSRRVLNQLGIRSRRLFEWSAIAAPGQGGTGGVGSGLDKGEAEGRSHFSLEKTVATRRFHV